MSVFIITTVSQRAVQGLALIPKEGRKEGGREGGWGGRKIKRKVTHTQLSELPIGAEYLRLVEVKITYVGESQ